MSVSVINTILYLLKPRVCRRTWSHIRWRRRVQYIPRNMHTVFALLCFVVVIHWLIFPYPPGLLHWHCGNLTIAPVPAKQPWWIWINTSCEFIMNDCITTTKQSTTKPCAYFLGYTVCLTDKPRRCRWWCGFSRASLWFYSCRISPSDKISIGMPVYDTSLFSLFSFRLIFRLFVSFISISPHYIIT